MLTEADKKWLEERETYPIEREAPYFCAHCPKRGHVVCARDCLDYWSIDGNCPVEMYDFRDVAEFEARVAAIMPYIVFKVVAAQAGQKDITIDAWECLKIARLAVEEEMG